MAAFLRRFLPEAAGAAATALAAVGPSAAETIVMALRGASGPLKAALVRALGKVEVVMYGSIPTFSQFSPIDAMPHAHTVTHARLEDYFHFAPVTSPHDLIVPQASVPELLERILQLQQPACEDRAKARVAARLLTL